MIFWSAEILPVLFMYDWLIYIILGLLVYVKTVIQIHGNLGLSKKMNELIVHMWPQNTFLGTWGTEQIWTLQV